MAVITITKDNFETEIINSATPVVVDFWATWCGPCQLQGLELEKFEAEYGAQVKVAKINVDEEPELAAKFGVASIPTLVKFDGGAEASRVVGFNDKAGLAKAFL